MAHFELEDEFTDQARIKVIGVGGAGGNALNTMISSALSGVEFIAANTDVQALERNQAQIRIQLGRDVTRGLGAGANPDKGREAALESVNEIGDALQGADMVFVTAGMGGGTGTGAAPVIAQVARECGALTVGVVTKPFTFEGRRRMRFANDGIGLLEDSVDTLITIPNDRLLQVASANTTVSDAFGIADEVLLHATQGVSDLITVPGLINVDFADVRTIMSNQGRALMGMGIGSDEGRAISATQQAINSPLLEDVTIRGARGILMNITAGPDLRMSEINEAASIIHESVDEDCNIIFGTVLDQNMGDALRITVIATGFDQHQPAEEELEGAIKTHTSRRSSQGFPAGNPMIGGPAGVRRQSAGRSMVGYSGASAQPQPQPQPEPVLGRRRAPAAEQTGLFHGGPAASNAGAPAQNGAAGHSSGSWSRGDLRQPEDHEVPAFLRRGRGEDGYLR